MPRYARIHVTSGLFHLISRFQDRRYYLDIDGARGKYLELLGKALQTHDCRLIAYCLMSSHVHLVAQLGNDSIGKLTKKIHAPFASWINRQRRGIGVVMADRPKSVLVHTETYGMELIRYVHNNPVRAGVVERAADSIWSSHRAYMGLVESPSWLATEAVFGRDAGEFKSIRKEMGSFVDEGRGEGRRPEFSGEVSNTIGLRGGYES
jgi:REP-associated tyrosine transposase